MINAQNLAELVETKLNQNSEGLLFKTFTFEHILDTSHEDKINYIPSIVTNPQGSYMPKNEIRGERLNFMVQILLPILKLNSWTSMLNDFIWSLNGLVFYVNDAYGDGEFLYKDGLTYKKVSTNEVVVIDTNKPLKAVKVICSVPSFGQIGPENMELQQEVASYLPINETQTYIDVQIPISIKSINNFSLGDEVIVYIRPVTTEALGDENLTLNPYFRVKTTDFTIKQTRMPLTEQKYGSNISETKILQTDTKYIMTVYYENLALFHDIVANMISGENANKKYWLKMQLIDRVIYQKVIIFDTSAVFPADEFAVIPLVLTKSMEV